MQIDLLQRTVLSLLRVAEGDIFKVDGAVGHLYAAGEVAGTGMYGTQYPTCGTSIGGALFFGRIAGRAATGQALL